MASGRFLQKAWGKGKPNIRHLAQKLLFINLAKTCWMKFENEREVAVMAVAIEIVRMEIGTTFPCPFVFYSSAQRNIKESIIEYANRRFLRISRSIFILASFPKMHSKLKFSTPQSPFSLV